MDSNNEEEIQEIISVNESEKGTQSDQKEGISIEENSVEAQRGGVDEKEQNITPSEGIKDMLCHQVRSCSYIRWRCGLSTVRVYQLWPGKNVFFFRGRLICGPDPRGFILSMISIIICQWIFSSYISYVSPRLPSIVSIISAILSIIVLTNLFLAGTRDPGIIPRNRETQLMETGTSTRSKSMMSRSRSRRVNVNGREIKVKYCRMCEIFRPPRSSHCAVCDNCVDKFDHHCPWIGQCVGLRNYRQYLMFVFSAFVYFLFIFVVSSQRIAIKMATLNKGILGIIGHMPETFALAIFSLMLVWFLGGLLVFHGYLISLNQTAHERFKQRYINFVNPYDKGARENIKEALFAKLAPSRLNFRATVEPKWNSIAKAFIYSTEREQNEEVQTEMQETDHNNDPENEEIQV